MIKYARQINDRSATEKLMGLMAKRFSLRSKVAKISEILVKTCKFIRKNLGKKEEETQRVNILSYKKLQTLSGNNAKTNVGEISKKQKKIFSYFVPSAKSVFQAYRKEDDIIRHYRNMVTLKEIKMTSELDKTLI